MQAGERVEEEEYVDDFACFTGTKVRILTPEGGGAGG